MLLNTVSLVKVHLKLGKTYAKHVNLSILIKFYRSLVNFIDH
jgi:hypothetical protein